MSRNGYIFDGQILSLGEFLDAVAYEYKHGDPDYAISKLEDEGFDLNDIGVRPAGV